MNQQSLFNLPDLGPALPAPVRRSSVDDLFFYQSSFGEYEAALLVLRRASNYLAAQWYSTRADLDEDNPLADAVRLLDSIVPARPMREDPATLPAPSVKADRRRAEYTGPWPRKRHSHKCSSCVNGVYCYKSKCRLPATVPAPCGWCR